MAVLRDLPRPCLELLEVLLVHGPLSRTRLAEVLDVDVDDPAFDAALRVLELWVVAWEYESLWYSSGSLRGLLPHPLLLGPPIAELLNPRTVDDLRGRAVAIGLPVGHRKVDIVEALIDFYADGDRVRALYAEAPSAQRELLLDAAWHNPVLRYEGAFLYTGRPDPAISWLITHGLAIADWQQIVVPREVGLAIRGDDWHPPLTPRPQPARQLRVIGSPNPRVATTDEVDRDASAAAGAAVEQMTALLDIMGSAPVALLKAGGIGVKEIRRLARATGTAEPEIRLWLEIAYATGLCDVGGEELLPSPRYDEWLASDPADRLAAIVSGWHELDTVPLIETRPDGVSARAVLADDAYGVVAAQLRADILAACAESTVPTEIAAMVTWRRPLICASLGDLDLVIKPVRAEAHLLGLLGRDILSTLGRVVVDEPALTGDRLAAIAPAFVRAPATEAIFQADLTVVVPGSPSVEIGALLDATADRESRGAAVTWRCSPSSVRRALDAGYTVVDLLTALRGIATGGTLPQPLEYLVADVARRHGELRARSVGCVLRCDDPALLTEIAATKGLASLRLSALAPTVLASAAGVDATLAALRAAGYAPVGEGADGTAVVERAARRRSPIHVPDQRLSRVRVPPLADSRELAESLLAAPPHRQQSTLVPEPLVLVGSAKTAVRRDPTRGSTMDQLSRYARQLDPIEWRLLADAIDNGRPVRIRYTSAAGVGSIRVVEPIELDDDALVAWCQLRDDERNFLLGRVDEVFPD